jgi:hypothetical protein
MMRSSSYSRYFRIATAMHTGSAAVPKVPRKLTTGCVPYPGVCPMASGTTNTFTDTATRKTAAPL